MQHHQCRKVKAQGLNLGEHQKQHLQQLIVRHQLRQPEICQPSSCRSSGRFGGRVEEWIACSLSDSDERVDAIVVPAESHDKTMTNVEMDSN